VLVDALGNPADITLTAGQAGDAPQAIPLIEPHDMKALLADKAYDSDAIIAVVEAKQAVAVIPPRRNRLKPRAYDTELYKERNLAERCINRLKQYRGIATRYDKLATHYLGAAKLVASLILLN
jgi:transposase